MKRWQEARRRLGLIGAMMVILGLSANCAYADTGNILLNPGAEGSMDNWNNHGSKFTTTSSYGPRSGSRLFYGGNYNESSQASQYVDVSGYAEAIDDGQVWASFSGYIKAHESDDGIFEMMFRTSGNSELQYHHAGWQSPDNWTNYSIENKNLVSNTRIVEIRMRSDRDYGDDNDGYFDDLSLWLKAPELEMIEPAVVTLYSAIDYGGRPLVITGNDSNLCDNLYNDIASSIKVPLEWKATLYKDINYAGGSLTKTADDSTLVNDGWNDVVSSIKVEGQAKFDFGNVYLATNQSAKDYNYSLKKIFRFKNAGDAGTKLKWSISGPAWVKFSQSSGDLADGGSGQLIEVWLEPTNGTGTYSGTITFTSTRGDVDVAVSATVYQTVQLSYVGPAKGSNDMVNVAENESVQYEVKANGPLHPGATLAAAGYRWKIETDNFGNLSDPKKSHAFQTSGNYDIQVVSCEKVGETEIWSDALTVPVRVWIRPQVNSSPPQSAIDDSLVSWYDNKYVGGKGETVYLMADGQKGSTDPNETITKYLWDFDNDWQTIELEQSAGEVVTHIWENANLSGSIKCKAVTNYGVKSDEKVFSLKIYDTALLDAKGPYTGKPNKAVDLACVMNQSSYPGAGFEYQWRVNGTPTDGTLKGSATQKTDYWEETAISGEGTLKGSATQETGYTKLTTNESSKNGQVEYVNLNTGENWSVSGEFWTGGSIGGADAFYIYAFATETPTSEDSAKKQYSVNYDEYQDQIQLKYDGSILKTAAQSSIDNSTWRQFKVVCIKGKFEVYLDNLLKLEYDDSTNYTSRATNNLFGFGARTGGVKNEHRVRNAQWNKRTLHEEDYIELTPNESDKNGQAEYANLQLGNKWSVSGDFWSGGGSGADVFYIYAFATETATSEDSAKKQYSVNYNEYSDQIQLKYDGITLGTIAQTNLDNSQWRQFAVRCDQGVFKIYLDHKLRLEYDDSTNYASRAINNLFGFGARTGSSNNYHRIKNMQWTLGTTTATDSQGKAKYTWGESGSYSVECEAVVTTQEGLVIINRATTTATIEAGKPTAMPGGPYRGGIDGGNFSPIQFSGNHPDYVEDSEIGHIDTWDWSFGDYGTATIYNPTCTFDKAGKYSISLKVRSEYGKWSVPKPAEVTVIDGKIAGYVRAADLRTPVKEVRLTLSSSHVDTDVLAQIAGSDQRLHTNEDGSIWTETDEQGYYEFVHIPLGTYRVRASKGEGNNSHEFQMKIKVTELTLDGPNQLAIDFVDTSVYPVGGRIVYSIQKNGVDVLVEGVKVKAQSAGGSGLIESLLSEKSLSAAGVNYSMPLFAGQYLFLAERSDRDIRIKKETPDYDEKTQLVTIKDARTDIDFIDYTTRKLTVFVQDSGGYEIASQSVTISGDNGQAEGISDENDGKFVATLNPGKYKVRVQGASPEEEEVDITAGDNSVKMTIPSKIILEISPRPKLFDVPDEFLEQFGLKPEDNPEGYMYYYSPSPRTHKYTVKATSNGHPVTDFDLFVRDEVSMLTEDAPEEQNLFVNGDEGEYIMTAGLPRRDYQEGTTTPTAGTKTIKFWATKEKYKDSDKVGEGIIVLGEVLEGSAAKIVSIPTVNYLVLHDPPGDKSYSYLDDKLTVKGIVTDMKIQVDDDREITVYPSPWSKERDIGNNSYGSDLKDRGLIGYEDTDPAWSWFLAGAGLETVSGGLTMIQGWLGWVFKLAKLGVSIGKYSTGGQAIPGKHFVQYEISPNRHLETPSGDTLPDILGPGKGDIYYGEGWTLGLQTKYLMGIERTGTDTEGNAVWGLTTEQIETYDILERTNQYIYTTRDIENIITDLGKTIEEKYLFSLSTSLKDSLNNGTVSDLQSAFSDAGHPLSGSSTIKAWLENEKWTIVDKENNKRYCVRNNGSELRVYEENKENETGKLVNSRDKWQYLLDENLAYVWQKDYLQKGKSFEDFKKEKGDDLDDKKTETLIFSAGPKFEYSREASTVDVSKYIIGTELYSDSFLTNEMVWSAGSEFYGNGMTIKYHLGSRLAIKSSHVLGSEFEAGQAVEQKVGFNLQDDDVGDNYSTRVYEDPRWGTPIFFTDEGSYSSDPNEPGTNRAVDCTLESMDEPGGTFDYQEGAYCRIKVNYSGARDLESLFQTINFALYAPQTDNQNNLTVKFNGTHEPYVVGLNKEAKSAIIALSLYPPEIDQRNSAEKEYEVDIVAQEIADLQITRTLPLKVKFADLRAPRATIVAPYAGQRISPALFPADDPFKIQVVSEDTDIASIQLQIRSKQPDGVWEPWRNLSGMKWEGTNTDVVSLFEYLDRVPVRREFTFKWTEAEIKMLGVGEYAIRAVATDKATKPNADLDPPDVVFLVDENKPSVLTSIPDYQASEAERIYRGELSVLFTDDMRASDFTDRTFSVVDLLESNANVAGYVSYSPALRKAIFVPSVPFKPYGYYRVEIKTDVKKTTGSTTTIERGVHDLAGNPLDNAFMWTFRTKDAPFEEVWSIGLSITDGMAVDGNNMAGVEYGAKDGTDEKDAPSVPAMAEQMRLSYLDRQKKEFDRDIRPADGRLSHHWFFGVVNAREYATVTLSWQPAPLLTKTDRQYQVMRLVEFDVQGNVTNNIPLDPTRVTRNQYGDPELTEIYSYVNKGELSRYFRLDVQKVDFVAKSFKKGSSGWRFFSAPVTPQQAEPFVNLGDDIDQFRLYEYKTALGGYKIYPFDLGEVSLETRHGYWTRLDRDVEVDVGGSSNFNDMTLELNNAGWHAIGNPFILAVNIADMEVREGTQAAVLFDEAVAAGLIEGTLYRWDIVTQDEQYMSEVPLSDSYEPATSNSKLQPWEGYWLKTRRPDITLVIPAPPGVATATVETPGYLKPPQAPRLLMSKQASLSPQFSLCMEVFSEGASDRSTILGTHQDAKSGQDALDSTEPPVMGQTVAAYFKHNDWGENSGLYNQDYQPLMDVGEQRTWLLTVYTDKPSTQMTVSWDKAISRVPQDIQLSFRKAGDVQWQDMRQVNRVELVSDTFIAKLKFEIQAERMEKGAVLAGGETRLLPCYPNPFQTGVWIPYELAQDSAVEIKIYNIAGELVRTLDQCPTSTGSHVVSWDGRNQSGEQVASGIYLCVFKAGSFTAVRKVGVCK